VRRTLAFGALALTTAGCASAPPPAGSPAQVSSLPQGKSALVRRLVESTVQLWSERADGGRRAASAVVVAADGATHRVWVATALHFLEPRTMAQEIVARRTGQQTTVPAAVAHVDVAADLAILEIKGLDVVPVKLKPSAALGDSILLIAFPWGKRFTVVGGMVSQIVSDGPLRIEGPARMIDATVTHGSSGGGVFDAHSGELIGIVESYRTARIGMPDRAERPLEIPVAGETTLIPAPAIITLLAASGLGEFVPK
jgi:serine protease Do